MSNSIASFEQYRRSSEVHRFSDEWLQEERMGHAAGNRHMDLKAWTKSYPHQALAIILTLLDKTEEDIATQESITLGEIENIVEWPADDFLTYLVHAVQTHPRFALCTKSMREHSESTRWKNLQDAVNASLDIGSS